MDLLRGVLVCGHGLELWQPNNAYVLKRPWFLYSLEHTPISERSSGGAGSSAIQLCTSPRHKPLRALRVDVLVCGRQGAYSCRLQLRITPTQQHTNYVALMIGSRVGTPRQSLTSAIVGLLSEWAIYAHV